MNLLKDKVAIITGSSRGIGRSIALKYSENGAKIILNHTKKGRDIDETVSALEAKNADFLIYKGSICDKAFIQAMIKDIIQQYGHIDILVNNAGVGITGPIEETPELEIKKAFDINLYGPINVIKLVLPQMRKQKSGLIINITSIAGYMGLPYRGIYSATKVSDSVSKY